MSQGPLNLSDYEETSFEALDSGTYEAEVFEASWGETKGGEDAQLPKGTPFLKIQFKVTEEKFENRRVFRNFIIPPKKVDGKAYKHYKMMNGMLVRFFINIGYSEEEVTGGTFEPDLEDLVGRPCRVVVKKRPAVINEDDGTVIREASNDVAGVKPVGAEAEASGSLL